VVCLRGLFEPRWLDLLAEGVERNLREPGPLAKHYTPAGSPGRFFGDYCNWQRIPEYRTFAFESPAAAAVADLLQTERVNFFHEHILVKEPGTRETTPWHHDQPYWTVALARSGVSGQLSRVRPGLPPVGGLVHAPAICRSSRSSRCGHGFHSRPGHRQQSGVIRSCFLGTGARGLSRLPRAHRSRCARQPHGSAATGRGLTLDRRRCPFRAPTRLHVSAAATGRSPAGLAPGLRGVSGGFPSAPRFVRQLRPPSREGHCQ